MASPASSSRKTLDDLAALGEGVLAELIDGELFMSPTPSLFHQRVVGRLFLRLSAWSSQRGVGEVCLSPLDVFLPSGDVVEPDVIYVSNARRAILKDWIRGVPDLLIEVLSPSNAKHDRVVKRELYEREGVPEYWIVDPSQRTVTVLRLGMSGYGPGETFSATDELRSPGLEGLSLSVGELFDS